MRAQAEAARRSDAALVGNTLDLWNAGRLADLQILARLPSMKRVLLDGELALPDDVTLVNLQLNALVHPASTSPARS